MDALSTLPAENERVILRCKIGAKTVRCFYWVDCSYTVCSAVVNQDLNEPSGPHIVSNGPVYRWRDILIGYLVWQVRSGAKHGQAGNVWGGSTLEIEIGCKKGRKCGKILSDAGVEL